MRKFVNCSDPVITIVVHPCLFHYHSQHTAHLLFGGNVFSPRALNAFRLGIIFPSLFVPSSRPPEGCFYYYYYCSDNRRLICERFQCTNDETIDPTWIFRYHMLDLLKLILGSSGSRNLIGGEQK